MLRRKQSPSRRVTRRTRPSRWLESLEPRLALTFENIFYNLNGDNGFAPVLTTDQTSDVQFTSVGDVNADGFDDLAYEGTTIIFNFQTFQVENYPESGILFGRADISDVNFALDTLSSEERLILRDTRRGENQPPTHIRPVGDLNGDGIPDIGVLSGQGPTETGQAPPANAHQTLFVVYGRQDWGTGILDFNQFGATDGIVFDADQLTVSDTLMGDFLGGDVDGDGHQDIVMTFVDLDASQNAEDSWVQVVFGDAAGFPAVVNLDQLSGIASHRFTRSQPSNLGVGFIGEDQGIDFGGDVNDDGFADLLIGSSEWEEEAAFVVYGGSRPAQATTVLDSMPANQGLRIWARPQTEFSSVFGNAVAFIDDVTGDGVDDFAVTSFQGLPRGYASGFGSVFIIHGKPGGWSSGIIDLASSLPSSELTEIHADARAGSFGYSEAAGWMTSVAGIEDINGDGVNDFLLHASDGISCQGKFFSAAYLVYGGSHLNLTREIGRDSIQGNLGKRMVMPDRRGGYDPINSWLVESNFDFDGDGYVDFLTTAGDRSRVVFNPIAIPFSDPNLVVEVTPLFPSTRLGRSRPSIDVIVANRGNQPLIVQPAEVVAGGGVAIVNNFTIDQVLDPGETITIGLQMLTDAVGPVEVTIRISSNDPDQEQFEFTATGNVTDAGLAEILHNGIVVPAGGTIDFGALVQGQAPVTETISVRNVGTAEMSLDVFALASNVGFSFRTVVPSTVELDPGDTVSFEVTMGTDTVGPKSATLVAGPHDVYPDVQLVGNILPIDVAPRLESLSLASETVPNSGTIVFAAEFSKPVTGVDATDFSVQKSSGLAFDQLSVVQSSTDRYLVSVTGLVGSGSISLEFLDDGSIQDFASQTLRGQFLSDQRSSYPVGDGPVGVEAIDLDGDGLLELISLDADSRTLTVLANGGNGTFTESASLPITGLPQEMERGDLNGDAKDDLVVFALNEIVLFLNNGDGTLVQSQVVPRRAHFGDLQDLDHDGNLDVVHTDGIQFGFFVGNGDGTVANNVAVSAIGSNFTFADFNSIGFEGILSTIYRYEGSRAGLSNRQEFSLRYPADQMEVGDLNQDGQPDLVYTSPEGFVGIRDSVLGAEISQSIGTLPKDLIVMDLNGDGIDDVIVSDLTEGVVRVFRGGGGNMFDSPEVLPTGASPHDIAAVDVDQDGHFDLLIANQDQNQISLIPGGAGSVSDWVTISSPSIQVLVDGDTPLLEPLDFGTIIQNTLNAQRAITARNLSNVDLVVQPATLTGGNGFSIVGNFSTNQVIGPGESVSLNVIMDSQMAGDQAATLQFSTNDPGQPTVQFNLEGKVLLPPEFVVTNTTDSGPGSFRQAVLDANQSLYDVTIRFDIPESDPGFIDIDSSSGLPGSDPEPDVFVVQEAVGYYFINNVNGRSITIDGELTPNDTNPHGPNIFLDGGTLPNRDGIIIESDNVSLLNMGFINWTALAVSVKGNHARLHHNFFGVDGSGLVAAGNQRSIEVASVEDVEITENVISGNEFRAIYLNYADSVSIQRNLIGVNAFGDAAIENAQEGIVVFHSTGVVIGGSLASQSNVIAANGSTGITIAGSLTDGVQVIGNTIGMNADRDVSIPNGGDGVLISDAASNVLVGGLNVGERNYISGNLGAGVKVLATGSGYQILGNRIGTDGDGLLPLGNSGPGIQINGDSKMVTINGNQVSGNAGAGILVDSAASEVYVSNNLVGTDRDGQYAIANDVGVIVRGQQTSLVDNLVSGNLSAGIEIVGSQANDVVLFGNFVGTNQQGDDAIPNGGAGISIAGNARRALVGSVDPLDANLVSGNAGHGLELTGLGAGQHQVVGNRIGTNFAGSGAIPNGGDGVLAGGQQNLVSGNTIHQNAGNGISVYGYRNQLSQNLISGNAGLGIDVALNGISYNDLLDEDTGPNSMQNAPLLTSVANVGNQTQVIGILHSKPNTTFHIELFDNSLPNGGTVQGEQFLEGFDVTTDADGKAAIDRSLSPQAGPSITATATGPDGDTSEFSSPGLPGRFDFGDAPLSYQTIMASDGAAHEARGPRLGNARDTELDGQPDPDARGDDSNGDDEDGVIFQTLRVGGEPGQLSIDLQSADTARVDAWIDFDQNGHWDSSEKILDREMVIAGIQILDFEIPEGAFDGPTYARVRVSESGGLSPLGFADNGEVEDYHVTLENPTFVESVAINDGQSQRSIVSSVVVRFDREVVAPAAAFSVTNRESGQLLANLEIQSTVQAGKTVTVIGFGTSDFAYSRSNGLNSLRDGTYQLRIDGSMISGVGSGEPMQVDAVYGARESDAFFRLFGDTDQDRDVDAKDFGRVASTLFKTAQDEGFDPSLDLDGDGDIDGVDFGRLRSQLLKHAEH